MVRRVAVIGAGVGGLASVKCCLDEGLEPTCFERSEDIGGVWRYTDSMDVTRVSVYRSVITNTSKEMSCFSDFPFPEDFPSYLPHSLLLEYFRMYAHHFDLLRHIHFKVFLSARSNTWVISRVSSHGFPFDMVNTTRFNHFLDWLLPSALTRRIRFWKFNSWFNHANYGLASTKSSKFKMIVNEELPFCLLSGTVVLKPSVKEFTESSAVFEDGTTEENIDVVLFATGYIYPFPFLEESVRSLFDDNRSLYKCIFPPQLEKPTLAIIGLIQLTGSIMVGSEMQARWVTGIFAGWNKLPPASRMMADVLKRKPPVKRKPSERENLKMSFISYTDDIAACAGVKPSVLRLLLTDPRLALAVFFGPCSPYQYRLVGRGAWSGARGAILTQWQRVLKPLRTRVVDEDSDCWSGWRWMCLLALPVALTVGFLLSKHPQLGWRPWAGPQL
ncbi:dimethylaniline monooxygenase [N-oxide-forming] 4-like isoform X5 [Pithys albifrons albifrons]|uniref:dimethylaniline monooxygenase [N-oxide-forming] 4-like isoform X5 n=1 Tax=Pithys albifrons albifrons TaxID=3385563 RepID=UPI003A5D12DA